MEHKKTSEEVERLVAAGADYQVRLSTDEIRSIVPDSVIAQHMPDRTVTAWELLFNHVLRSIPEPDTDKENLGNIAAALDAIPPNKAIVDAMNGNDNVAAWKILIEYVRANVADSDRAMQTHKESLLADLESITPNNDRKLTLQQRGSLSAWRVLTRHVLATIQENDRANYERFADALGTIGDHIIPDVIKADARSIIPGIESKDDDAMHLESFVEAWKSVREGLKTFSPEPATAQKLQTGDVDTAWDLLLDHVRVHGKDTDVIKNILTNIMMLKSIREDLHEFPPDPAIQECIRHGDVVTTWNLLIEHALGALERGYKVPNSRDERRQERNLLPHLLGSDGSPGGDNEDGIRLRRGLSGLRGNKVTDDEVEIQEQGDEAPPSTTAEGSEPEMGDRAKFMSILKEAGPGGIGKIKQRKPGRRANSEPKTGI